MFVKIICRPFRFGYSKKIQFRYYLFSQGAYTCDFPLSIQNIICDQKIWKFYNIINCETVWYESCMCMDFLKKYNIRKIREVFQLDKSSSWFELHSWGLFQHREKCLDYNSNLCNLGLLCQYSAYWAIV